jgi:hypothetical protein
LAGQHRLLDLLQEGALAADALQAPVEDLVAGGRDLVDLDLVSPRGEEVADVPGLPQRQQAGARSDSDPQETTILADCG